VRNQCRIGDAAEVGALQLFFVLPRCLLLIARRNCKFVLYIMPIVATIFSKPQWCCGRRFLCSLPCGLGFFACLWLWGATVGCFGGLQLAGAPR
jgi:hypothetical protein